MFYHFNNHGTIQATHYKLNPENNPKLQGFNYPEVNVAYQAWKKWAIDYLNYCFTLNGIPQIHYRHRSEYEA